MKKTDIRILRVIILSEEEYKIPDGWEIVKDPTKITINGVDSFQAVIAKN